MDRRSFGADDASPTCSLSFLDCLTPQNNKTRNVQNRFSRRVGVERQMPVSYNQPHLVEPMKLTVYDTIPTTPVQAHSSNVSQIMSQSRRVMSRASTRASLHHRKKSSTRLLISNPQPMGLTEITLRRKPSFRPLQLSIYVPGNRLSDLPSFDNVSFTDLGEIRAPPRALIRTQSEELLRTVHAPGVEFPETLRGKPASMFEQTMSRRVSVVSHVRKDTASSVISTSRPPSEYDALNSHPVSWIAAPGLPLQIHMAAAPNNSVTVLSPMQEEFTPPPTGAVMIDGTILSFPDVDAARTTTEQAHSSLLPPAPGQREAAPSPIVDPGPSRRTALVTQHKSQKSQAVSIREIPARKASASFDQPLPYFHTNFATNNRINQWLSNEPVQHKSFTTRSRESSVSTVKTSTTTSSFAEHRRKRSEFYQLNKTLNPTTATAPANSSKTQQAPTPLSLYKLFPPSTTAVQNPVPSQPNTMDLAHRQPSRASSHTRADTQSTVASTIATDVLFEDAEDGHDAISMTTYDDNGMKSRTGTMKSTVTHKTTATAASDPPAYEERQANPTPEIIAVTKISPTKLIVASTAFDFTRAPSPSPRSLGMPGSPMRQVEDVEKYMHDLCGQRGLRRINVGVAF